MKTLALLLLISALATPAFAKHRPLQTAKVISQNIGSYRGGAISTANGSAFGNSATATAIAVPIIRTANVVVIETGTTRLTLLQVTGRNYMLLTVNGTVNFYIEGNRAILEDAKGKKHKFFITRMENISASESVQKP